MSRLAARVVFTIVSAAITAKMASHVLRSLTWPAAANYEDARRRDRRGAWRAGDLLLVANAKGNSLGINFASGAPWTHVGILVPAGGKWFLWHSDAPDTRPDATVPAGAPGSLHSGVQLTPLDFFLDTTEAIATRVPAPRGVRVPALSDLHAQVDRTCREGRKHGFDFDIPRLAAVARSDDPTRTWMWPVRDAGGAWFCSGFVAEIYHRWGWDMNGATDPRAFHPKHFVMPA